MISQYLYILIIVYLYMYVCIYIYIYICMYACGPLKRATDLADLPERLPNIVRSYGSWPENKLKYIHYIYI